MLKAQGTVCAVANVELNENIGVCRFSFSNWPPCGGWNKESRSPRWRGALEFNPNVLHRWRREFRHGPGNAFPGNGKLRWSEGRIAELERKIGQQALEIDFLKGVLAAHRGAADAAGITENPPSTGRSKRK